MLDIESLVRRAVREASAGRSVTIALPFDAPEQVLRDMVARGLIGAYVADGGGDQAVRDPVVAGWWTDRRNGSWCLKRSGPSTLILLGADAHHSVSGRMLLEARLAGVRRIVLAGSLGNVLQVVDAEAELLKALDRARVGPQIGASDFEDLFHDMRSWLGDWLRLPGEAFVRNRALMMVGSLGPGGAERQVAYTTLGLQRKSDLEIYVACDYLDPPGNDFFRSALEAAGVYTFEVARQSADWTTPKIQDVRERLARYKVLGVDELFHAIFHYAIMLRSARPSLVHTWMDHCSTLAGLAAVLVGVPKIVLGGRSFSPESFRFFQPFMRPAYRAILDSRPDALLLNNSRSGAADYARWLGLPTDRVGVIHNGFDFPDEIPFDRGRALRRELGLGDEDTVVGSILRFSEEKRPGLMVETARALLARRPGTKFVFFGQGVLLEDMRKVVAEAGLEDAIKLPGLTRDAWAAIATMDAFLLTSRIEGLPNVLVEAGAMGVPIVCTGVGGMAETFIEDETGFSVEADPRALADKLASLLDDEGARRHIRNRAPAHVRHDFGIDSMVTKTILAYSGL
ncbi:MAG: glycosyltransferase [Janthinobacterium lividum]